MREEGKGREEGLGRRDEGRSRLVRRLRVAFRCNGFPSMGEAENSIHFAGFTSSFADPLPS